jgi:hypothetical protein
MMLCFSIIIKKRISNLRTFIRIHWYTVPPTFQFTVWEDEFENGPFFCFPRDPSYHGEEGDISALLRQAGEGEREAGAAGGQGQGRQPQGGGRGDGLASLHRGGHQDHRHDGQQHREEEEAAGSRGARPEVRGDEGLLAPTSSWIVERETVMQRPNN